MVVVIEALDPDMWSVVVAVDAVVGGGGGALYPSTKTAARPAQLLVVT